MQFIKNNSLGVKEYEKTEEEKEEDEDEERELIEYQHICNLCQHVVARHKVRKEIFFSDLVSV